MSSCPPPRGENENFMRNKLRALNWFGQTLSDDLWDFASKQCAFNPNCGKTTIPPRPSPSHQETGSVYPPFFVARERDPPDGTPAAAPSRSRGSATLPDESEGMWEECGSREEEARARNAVSHERLLQAKRDWENSRRTVTDNRLVSRIVDEELVVYSCAGQYE